MSKITSIIVCMLTLILTASCDKNDEKSVILQLDDLEYDYLIFGWFHNMCVGESCNVAYKLGKDKLLKAIDPDFRVDDFKAKYIKLSQKEFEQAKDLIDYFPSRLLKERETVFGCPDCADGGGLYIEYNFNGVRRFWSIDKTKTDLPNEFLTFFAIVDEKIALLLSME